MKAYLTAALSSALLVLSVPVHAQSGIENVLGGVAQTLLNQELDKRAYAAAKSQNTANAYRSYLSQFPNGVHQNEAQAALNKLAPTTAVPVPAPIDNTPLAGTPASAESRLGLSRAQRTVVQQQLTAQGYNTGGADGLWGARTRDALRKWQSANGYSVTGYLTADQFAKLNRVTNTPLVDANQDAALEESLLGLTRDERREGQRRLTSLGYNTRGTDGVWGANTRTALRNWQRDLGLEPTGYVSADQWRDLRLQAGY